MKRTSHGDAYGKKSRKSYASCTHAPSASQDFRATARITKHDHLFYILGYFGRKPHLRVLSATLSEALCAMAFVSNPRVPNGKCATNLLTVQKRNGLDCVRCKELELLQKPQKREIFCQLFDLSKSKETNPLRIILTLDRRRTTIKKIS